METELLRQIEKLVARAWDELREAADKKNAAALNPIHARLAELERMKKDCVAMVTRIREMSDRNGDAKADVGLRRLRIRVTQGCLNQNLLVLTDALRAHQVRTYEQFKIEALPSHEKFDTVLVRPGNKLKERGAIGRFYRDAGVEADDIVEMFETAPGTWVLQAAPVELVDQQS